MQIQMNGFSLNRLKRAVGLLVLPLLGLSIVLTNTQAQDSPTVAETGIEFEGFRSLNQAEVVSTEYVGECPGSNAGSVKARFLSRSTPPAAGLRVVIRNLTRGIGGDREPYTDREYSKGRLSEGFFVVPATRHSGKYFAVLEGQNDLEYQIRQGDRVVESGSFTIEIDRETRTLERDAKVFYEDYCVKRNTSLDKCRSRDIRSRVVRRCPGDAGYY